MDYKAIIRFKTPPNPDNFEHGKYILEKHLNDHWVEVEIIEEYEVEEN